MATARPGTGRGLPEPEKIEPPPVKKNWKGRIFAILAVLLLAGGGAAAYLYFSQNNGTDSKKAEAPVIVAPKYVALGTFTVNLVHEDSDRYLQTAISVKLTNPALEQEIKAKNPEILDHVNLLLSSQRPSVLATIAGKQKLARDIRNQIEIVLGLRSAATANETQANATQAGSAPVATDAQTDNSGIAEVLFTSFIIQ